jgi:glycine cleavage system H protein
MTFMSARIKSYPVIPEEEQKCIWMMNGSVSYKLCDRNYECESCPFYHAIKNGKRGEGDFPESRGDWTGEGSLDSDPSIQINGTIFYHPDHCWVKVENSGKAKVGMDYLLAQLINDVKIVILPQVGCAVSQGECCAHIIQEDYILPVLSPLSGSIQMVNPRLQKEPGLITTDSQEEGWLVTIKPDNIENDLKRLLFGRKALSWYQMEEREITNGIEMMLKSNPQAVGPTMQDGGVRIRSLKDMLNSVSSKQRARILDSYMARTKNHKGTLSEIN